MENVAAAREALQGNQTDDAKDEPRQALNSPEHPLGSARLMQLKAVLAQWWNADVFVHLLYSEAFSCFANLSPDCTPSKSDPSRQGTEKVSSTKGTASGSRTRYDRSTFGAVPFATSEHHLVLFISKHHFTDHDGLTADGFPPLVTSSTVRLRLSPALFVHWNSLPTESPRRAAPTGVRTETRP